MEPKSGGAAGAESGAGAGAGGKADLSAFGPAPWPYKVLVGMSETKEFNLCNLSADEPEFCAGTACTFDAFARNGIFCLCMFDSPICLQSHRLGFTFVLLAAAAIFIIASAPTCARAAGEIEDAILSDQQEISDDQVLPSSATCEEPSYSHTTLRRAFFLTHNPLSPSVGLRLLLAVSVRWSGLQVLVGWLDPAAGYKLVKKDLFSVDQVKAKIAAGELKPGPPNAGR